MSRGRMTPRLTAEVACEIDARAGARVRAVHQDNAATVRLDMRWEDERADLVVALDPTFPRILFQRPRKAPREPSGLAGALRKQLVGARVVGAESVPGERALCVRFARGEERRTLWVELFGGQANWYLLDDDGAVLWTLRGEVAARRDASQGQAFQPMAPRASEDDVPPADDATGSEAIRSLWRDARSGHTETSAAARLRRVLKSALRRARKSEATLKAALANEGRADELESKGELLRGAFHLLRPGLERVLVPDYTSDPPTEVEIELDATLPPGEQVGACFQRARRLRRAAEQARVRHGNAGAERAAIEAAMATIAPEVEAPDLDAVVAGLPDSLRAEAQASLEMTRPHQAKPKGPTRAQPWRTYQSADGWDIHVGRDARGNDELTLRKARPSDLFLHVRGVAGSHVIVPTPRGKSVPRETLLDAAELACHFSSRAKAERNEVDYTPRRYVRKPKGSAPGLVVVERSKTLSLRRDEARRKRLLASGGARRA